eukprot:4703053-Lingulodinium_polyedra.AAC.1
MNGCQRGAQWVPRAHNAGKLSASTPQHLNASTPERLDASTPPCLGAPRPRRLITSAPRCPNADA